MVIILGSMAGYSFAKLEFPGRNFLFFGMLGGLMVPFEVLMIPLFILVVRMKLANTFPGIILPMAAGPFGIFVMRQYLLSIPDELLDAARVDGASEFTVFWRIVMPMSKPAVAALGTLIAIGAWNMFIWPLIVTSKEEMRVLTLAISILQLEYRGLYGTMMAAATVAFVPALAIFLLFQRYFVQGIALSDLRDSLGLCAPFGGAIRRRSRASKGVPLNYRSAILGCGPRGKRHAEVYPDIPNMDLVACCDLDGSRRDAFAKAFSIPATYAAVDEMVAREQLDVLHLVTQPDVRLDVIASAAEAGVAAVIVEKPLTLWPSEAVKIEELAARTGCKVIVNTQRRYFPQYAAIRDLIRSGRVGEVEFIRASTWGGPLAMGPHLLDLVVMVLDDEQPEAVWASAEGLEGYEWSHAAPSHVMATFWFPGERRVFWECSPRGLGTRGETEYWMHLHLDVWCTKGVIWAEQVGTGGIRYVVKPRSSASPQAGGTSPFPAREISRPQLLTGSMIHQNRTSAGWKLRCR